MPEGRVKPWGTGHAVMCCRGVIDGPFAVLNSDDFYGPEAFSAMYQFLRSNDDPACYAMVGYHLRNTVTEFGSVARGILSLIHISRAIRPTPGPAARWGAALTSWAKRARTSSR